MKVYLTDANRDALGFITDNLRPRDKEEIFALRWDDDTTALADQTLKSGDFQWIAWCGNEPVASIGAYPVWPGMWTVWAFGTKDWPRVVLSLTRHVKWFMIPAIKNHGGIRAQCFAMEKHEDARKWLTSLGAIEEAKLDNFGKNRQTFVCYSWLRDRTS